LRLWRLFIIDFAQSLRIRSQLSDPALHHAEQKYLAADNHDISLFLL
jgi:hypothetical protein